MPAKDAISRSVRMIRDEARRPRTREYWTKVEADLRAFVSELMLYSRPPPFVSSSKLIAAVKAIKAKARRAQNDRDYWREIEIKMSALERMIRLGGPPVPVRFGTAKIADAKKQLAKIYARLGQARELFRLVANFDAQVFGRPGLVAFPDGAMNNLERALGLIAEHMARREVGLSQAIAGKRRTAGSRATVSQRATGMPIVRFLQRFMLLWKEATGRSRLGQQFEGVAQDLIEVAVGRAPNDLRRQILEAKRRGPVVLTEWTLMTEIENLPLHARPPR
jgi:hypothetical protein